MRTNSKIIITFLKINFITIVLLFSIYTGLSQGALTLDQSFTGSFTSNMTVCSYPLDGNPNYTEELGQSFTVGISGQLSQVDIYLAQHVAVDGDLTSEIYNITDGLPVGTPLASKVVSQSQVDSTFSWVSIDFTALGLYVTAGDVISINLTYGGGGEYNWARGANGYVGGTAMYTYTDPGWTDDSWHLLNADFGFKSYIEPVPIPGAVWLLGSGLIGIVGIRRKFKK